MLRRLIEALPAIDRLVSPDPRRLKEPWVYQRVVEGALTFERVWLETNKKMRICLHAHEAQPTAELYWHPHFQSLAVISVGRYELFLGKPHGEVSPNANRLARVVVHGAFGYELVENAHHAVRFHSPTDSIVMFGDGLYSTSEDPFEGEFTYAIEVASKIRSCIARIKAAGPQG